MVRGILHKYTLDGANLKQIGDLMKNSLGVVVVGGVGGWDKCLNNLSDLIDTTAVL